MSNETKFDLVVKIVICGESGVGKTNLLTRYLKNEFNTESIPTIGVDFFAKDFILQDSVIKIQFFDTAGQEKYRSISSSYYKNADGIILVYDITDWSSYDELENWMEDVKSKVQIPEHILLVGNKIDLETERNITIDEGRQYAKQNNIFFAETSAKTNQENCVMKGFEILIQEITTNLKEKRDLKNSQELEEIRKQTIKFGFDESVLVQEKSKCNC